MARPASWRHAGDPPVIYVVANGAVRAPAVGDRLLARLRRAGDGSYDAQPMHRIVDREPATIVGRFQAVGAGGVITPSQRGRATEFSVADAGPAATGDLVRARVTRRGRHRAEAEILDVIAPAGHPRAFSLAAIHDAEIPHEFPAEVEAAADAAEPPSLGSRTDLRGLPLVTIDGADARDFDDAVFAEPDRDGWHLVVAIADVAHYVRPGSALDREAYNRGNSVYFPDMVVPMLPAALSNGLCSLRPDEDRACLAVHLWLDGTGTLRKHRFERALMRSTARLTYTEAQRNRDQPPLKNLFAAYEALAAARQRRGCLELDLPERAIDIADDGTVRAIDIVDRHDSHRLIEEFMITANVAAALTLDKHRQPALYRVHDDPDPERVDDLRRALGDAAASLPPGQRLQPALFNKVITAVADEPHGTLINTLILRAQAQANYHPNNTGHFGLALRHYAHFTSPIRRYADLVVHRGLIAALGLGDGGAGPEEIDLDAAGQHVSAMERRAAVAERGAKDRFAAAFLADHVGATFTGHISGVTRFGLFVTLAETGADGLVPMSRLPAAEYDFDARAHALTDRRRRRAYRLGDPHEVRLAEADGLSGSLVFDLLTGPESPPSKAPGRRGPRRAGPRHSRSRRRGNGRK